jgi:hypothetical protein
MIHSLMQVLAWTYAGFSLDLGPLSIHVPLYQSWDDTSTPDGMDWIKDRIRFEIDFARHSFRIGF